MHRTLAGAIARAPSRLFYGWWIAISFMVASMYSSGVFVHGASALFKPLREEFGWSAATISTALALQRLEGGLAAPIVGNLFDRLGPRKLFLFGIVVMSLGFVLLSRTSSLWMFYLAFIIAAMGHSSQAPTLGLATVTHWFNRNRGKAIAIVVAGGGAAGVFVPLLVYLIDEIEWRNAMLIAAGGFWIFGLPFVLIARHRPESMGLLPDGDPPAAVAPSGSATFAARARGGPEDDFTFREAARTRSFWMLGIGFALVQLTISSMLVHIIPALEDAGISRQTAAFAVTGVTLVSLVGRVGFGWASDAFDKRWLLVIALVMQVGGVLLFLAVHSVATLIPFILLYGVGFGGGLPVRPALQADYFGLKSFGTIQGAFISLTSVTAMASPVIAGAIKDATDEYELAFLILAIGSALAAPLILMAGRPVRGVRAPRRVAP